MLAFFSSLRGDSVISKSLNFTHGRGRGEVVFFIFSEYSGLSAMCERKTRKRGSSVGERIYRNNLVFAGVSGNDQCNRKYQVCTITVFTNTNAMVVTVDANSTV